MKYAVQNTRFRRPIEQQIIFYYAQHLTEAVHWTPAVGFQGSSNELLICSSGLNFWVSGAQNFSRESSVFHTLNPTL